MIVGTAGHIDHGKTTLVRALTGVDTDRLKEEKARGISIELGYAYVRLGHGGTLGFVDVPGHENLVHTMAAGACGIDFALLVIAADDGVMPQTREHVSILELFGVSRGAVALTKTDRVDAVRLQSVEREVRAFLASSLFRDAALFRVNATAQQDAGTRMLMEHLEGAAGAASPRDQRDCGLFRLAIDRVFTLPGHGTAVAGTVFSGTVSVGHEVTLFPDRLPVRVRSIHAQNRPAHSAHAGDRCAVTLASVARSEVRRGAWLADPRLLSPAARIDVRLRLLPQAGAALKPWSPVHFHHGAGHCAAHVIPLDREIIRAGESAHAQIVFSSPVCVVCGDRFVIRDAQALRTLGGGTVLDPCAPARRRRSSQRMRYLAALERLAAGCGPESLLAEAPFGIAQSELLRLMGRPLRVLPEGTLAIEAHPERFIVLASAWQTLCNRTVDALQKFHADAPDEPGPDIGRLRRIAVPQLPAALWRAVLAQLTREGRIRRAGPWLHLPGHTVTLSEGEQTLAHKLQPLVAAGGFNPPWVRDLANALNQSADGVRGVLRKQLSGGSVYQVVPDLFYDRSCIEELARLAERLAQDTGAVDAARFRDATRLGRKRAIQILEFFDRVGFTRRVRDRHILRSDSGWSAR